MFERFEKKKKKNFTEEVAHIANQLLNNQQQHKK